MKLKTRIHFEPTDYFLRAAIDAGKDYQRQHGGRAILLEVLTLGSWWAQAVYWYSPEYTPSEIRRDPAHRGARVTDL